MTDEQKAARAESMDLMRENAALRKALEPFAQAADVKLCGEWKDHERFGRTDVNFYLTFGDLRNARAALSNAGFDAAVIREGMGS